MLSGINLDNELLAGPGMVARLLAQRDDMPFVSQTDRQTDTMPLAGWLAERFLCNNVVSGIYFKTRLIH